MTIVSANGERSSAVAVYCASSIGTKPVYVKAAISLGSALAQTNRRLVYGGGARGLMGVVSRAVLENGGHATGVIPYAMAKAGGEKGSGIVQTETKDCSAHENGKQTNGQLIKNIGSEDLHAELSKEAKARLEVIVVQSMHERKVKMAERSGGFIGLPGGFGTFEEVFEVITWTQLGIHIKPVVLLSVQSYYEPLKQMINDAISEGFIHPQNGKLITFIDGPEDQSEHETFDWGKAALSVLDGWADDEKREIKYDWSGLKSIGSYDST